MFAPAPSTLPHATARGWTLVGSEPTNPRKRSIGPNSTLFVAATRFGTAGATSNIDATQLFANKVLKLPNDGTPLASADLPLPSDIAVNAGGNVYASVFSIVPGSGRFPGSGAVWRGTL